MSTERDFGQGIGPIPNSKVIDYGIRKGLEPDMLDVFEVVMDKLDDAYLRKAKSDQDTQHAADQREAARGAGKTKVR